MKSSKLILRLVAATAIITTLNLIGSNVSLVPVKANAETATDKWKLTWSDEFNGDKINSSN